MAQTPRVRMQNQRAGHPKRRGHVRKLRRTLAVTLYIFQGVAATKRFA
jgi:hypothetical protein